VVKSKEKNIYDEKIHFILSKIEILLLGEKKLPKMKSINVEKVKLR
jgi:hypothetical protein